MARHSHPIAAADCSTEPYPAWLLREINLTAAPAAPDNATIHPELTAFARWLFSFQKWQRQRYTEEDNRYYLMLGRRVHLQLHCSWAEGAAYLQQLAAVTARAGHALTVRMAMDHALHPPTAIQALLEKRNVQKFLFNLPSPIPTVQIPALVELVELLLSCRVMPILLGDMAELLRSGLLQHPRLNAANFTLYPSQRHMDFHPSHPVDNCANHFSWFIDRHGDIYPCGGLSGLASCRLGTIQEEFTPILQRLQQHPTLNFKQLIHSGPRLSSTHEQAVNRSNIPFKCLVHRRELQQLTT